MMSWRCLKALIVLMVFKWPWPAHAAVVEEVYKALPAEVQEKLDLEKMKDGSNDPDEKFKDTRAHSYPASFKRANKWLEEGQQSYTEKDYENASYRFGVVAHYISDTFAAPHCVKREDPGEHHDYEIVANDLTPQISYLEGDLDTIMKNGVEQGKIDWENWKKTQDQEIVQESLNRGASAAYTAIKDVIS
jgi:hypothetical protein